MIFCDAVYDRTNRINLKFCRDRKILALTFLSWENLKRHYFFKSVSIILYNKSMWQFSLISWNYKYDFFSIFSDLMFRGWNTGKVISLKYFGFNFNYSGFLVNNNLLFNVMQYLHDSYNHLLSVPHLIILILAILIEVSKIKWF